MQQKIMDVNAISLCEFDNLQRHLLAMRDTRGSDEETLHMRAARETIALDDFRSRRRPKSGSNSCWTQYSRPQSQLTRCSSATITQSPQPIPRRKASHECMCDNVDGLHIAELHQEQTKTGSTRGHMKTKNVDYNKRDVTKPTLQRLQQPTVFTRNKLSVRRHFRDNIRLNRQPDMLFRHYVDNMMSLRC